MILNISPQPPKPVNLHRIPHENMPRVMFLHLKHSVVCLSLNHYLNLIWLLIWNLVTFDLKSRNRFYQNLQKSVFCIIEASFFAQKPCAELKYRPQELCKLNVLLAYDHMNYASRTEHWYLSHWVPPKINFAQIIIKWQHSITTRCIYTNIYIYNIHTYNVAYVHQLMRFFMC